MKNILRKLKKIHFKEDKRIRDIILSNKHQINTNIYINDNDNNLFNKHYINIWYGESINNFILLHYNKIIYYFNLLK